MSDDIKHTLKEFILETFLPGEDASKLTDFDAAHHRRRPGFDCDAEASDVPRGDLQGHFRRARGRRGAHEHHFRHRTTGALEDGMMAG